MADLTLEQLAELTADAERYRYLREHNLTVLEIRNERRGYRSTAPGAQREVWTEHAGWTVSDLPILLEFTSMDEAVEASRAQRAGLPWPPVRGAEDGESTHG